jgi:hypothetical protein
MKVEVIKEIRLSNMNIQPGSIIEVSQETGIKWIKSGHARPYQEMETTMIEPQIETEMKPKVKGRKVS